MLPVWMKFQRQHSPEHWADGSAQHVFKVQMAYNGAVAGRKSPSYPADTDDLDRVLDAIRRVRAGEGEVARARYTIDALFRGKSPEEWRELYRGAYDWGPDVGREIVER